MPTVLQRRLLPLVLLLWLATFLRFYQLDGQSFWNDEGNSARLSERSLALILEGTASDVHPPLYYLLLRGWRELVGETEFGLRSLSAFVGVLTVAASAALAGAFARRRTALVLGTAAAAALHPALVYYSQEARMYALVAWWGVLSTLLLWRWLRSGRWWFGAAYALSIACGLYTHYIFPAILPAHGMIMLLRGRRRAQWRDWLVACAVSGLLFLPWLPIFRGQIGTRATGEVSAAAFLAAAARFLAFGETLGADEGRWGLIAVSLLWLLAFYAAWTRPGRDRRVWLVPLAGLAAPGLLMLAGGATRPAFHKFLVLGAPFASMLAARGAALGWDVQADHAGREASRLVTMVLVGLALVTALESLRGLYFDPVHERADYRGIAQRIEAEGRPSAGIILDAPNQWEVFTYYYRGNAPVYPLPRGEPDPAALAVELGQILARHDRLYVVFWGDAERDPQRLVERWLDEHAFKATEEWVGDVRFVTYAVPGAPAEEMEVEAGLLFGGLIRLLGYTVEPRSVVPGDIVTVTLFWEAVAPVEMRYKVFLHLVGPDGLLAQRDSEPGGGLALTTTWEVGRQIQDRHGVLVPVGAKPGPYTLLMGFYELTDPTARLPVITDAGIVDAVELALIEVQ